VPVGDPASQPKLQDLMQRVRRDLDFIEAPLRPWVPERQGPDGAALTDVVVVGAGLSGLSVAFGLWRQGVQRVLVIDAAEAGREGPWVTTARMRTLRSPKTLSGPDHGIPSLTYRAWHEAVFGEEDWERIDKIDRHHWAQYLLWFRGVTGLAVRNGTTLLDIGGDGRELTLQVREGDTVFRLFCRKVVLATGIEGAGGAAVPDIIAGSLPRRRWTHSSEPFDLAALAGKEVGVIGAAASGFDWAVGALEASARSVTLVARSAELPRTEILDWSNFPGFLDHFGDLDDAARYRFARRLLAYRTPPTQEMYDAAHAFANFRMIAGLPLTGASIADGRIRLESETCALEFDHLLLGTGYEVDLARRPELASFQNRIALWRDRFRPPAGEEDATLLGYPYLGLSFELVEKVAGTAPFPRHVHVFNNSAVLSLGPVCNGITGLKSGVRKLVGGITRGLFADDADQHFRSLDGYRKVHFNPQPASASGEMA
jgi:cation diffusion facilitator CzcD-associated flavoprotein CzcO